MATPVIVGSLAPGAFAAPNSNRPRTAVITQCPPQTEEEPVEVLERAESLLTPAATVYAARTPFDANRVGAAAVYCSDGRFGEQMDEFLHEGLVLPRYDRVAIPGGAACLAGRTSAQTEKTALERQLGFLIEEHGLRRVVLIAHDGCAFYKTVWLGGKSV